MPHPKHIQIDIPNPCNQPWDEMTPSGQGRFCGHCQKTVIDFTSWSDAAMYRFFSENTGKVCGRFLSTQTGRPIHIPPQPHSWLYRMTIALGLTLLFTQGTEVVAQNKPPRIVKTASRNNSYTQQTTNGLDNKVRGRVINENNEPVYNAVIQASQAGIVKTSVATDIDGYYIMSLTVPGYYDIKATLAGHDTITHYKHFTQQKDTATINFTLFKSDILTGKRFITGESEYEAQYLGKPRLTKGHIRAHKRSNK